MKNIVKGCNSLCLSFLLLSGCISHGLNVRIHSAESIAYKSGFNSVVVPAGLFHLQSYQRLSDVNKNNLVIYIEGDGFAWVSPYRQSSDPTPQNPLALKLAMLDGRSNVIYLGRPCQYVKCTDIPNSRVYWGKRRFSEEVIQAYLLAVDEIKSRNGSVYIDLVGFSGGGSIAILLAARRSDIKSVVTVAGNLDTSFFSDYHSVSSLLGSYNPSDFYKEVDDLPQIHFVGMEDNIIPSELVESYVSRGSDRRCVGVIEVSASHHSGWEESWRDLIGVNPKCNVKNQ